MASRYNEIKYYAYREYETLYKQTKMSLEDIVLFAEDYMKTSEYEQVDDFFITLYYTISYLYHKENIDFMKDRIRNLYKKEYMPYYKEKVVEEFLTDVEQIKKHLCID